MKKNKGIVIMGGEMKAKNVAVGKKSKIEQTLQPKKDKKSKEVSPENKEMIGNLKMMISNGELKEVIEKLFVHFKEGDNKEGLNATIMHSSSLTQLEMKEDSGLLTHDQAKIDRAKVTNSMLRLIDNQIK